MKHRKARPEVQTLIAKDPRDRIFYASEHPCHYNAWRRYGMPRRENEEDPVGCINGEPFRGAG